jgi:protein-disulfide isomerase
MSEQKSGLKGIELTPSVSILLAGLIIAGSIVFVNMKPAESAGTAGNEAAAAATEVAVPAPTASDHIVGSLTAPIVLIEYSDFQCPYCQMIYPTIKQIVAESRGEVAWVLRNYPLYQIHPQALPTANAAECIASLAGEGAFWKFVDTLFTNQDKLSADFAESTAISLGAEKAAYESCIKNTPHQERIDTEAADAQANGGSGTPYTVVLNTKTGKQFAINGALPAASIKAVISKALNSLY